MNATKLLEVANKVFINRENEEKREAEKRMKARCPCWLQHWGSQTQLSSQLHHGRGDPMGEPHSGETNVPNARRLVTGKMNVPIARGHHRSLTELLQERREDGSPNWRPKISLA
jgi:hypothetical protein